jgi:hypothetical protein
MCVIINDDVKVDIAILFMHGVMMISVKYDMVVVIFNAFMDDKKVVF